MIRIDAHVSSFMELGGHRYYRGGIGIPAHPIHVESLLHGWEGPRRETREECHQDIRAACQEHGVYDPYYCR